MIYKKSKLLGLLVEAVVDDFDEEVAVFESVSVMSVLLKEKTGNVQFRLKIQSKLMVVLKEPRPKGRVQLKVQASTSVQTVQANAKKRQVVNCKTKAIIELNFLNNKNFLIKPFILIFLLI